MGHMRAVVTDKAAGKAEPRLERGKVGKGQADRARLVKRRKRLEGKQIGLRLAVCKHENALAMELDQFGKAAIVVAVILGAVVQRRAIWTERKSKSAPLSACITCFTNSAWYPLLKAGSGAIHSARRRASSASSTSRCKRRASTSSSIQSPFRTSAKRAAQRGLGAHVQHHGAIGGAAHARVADAHHVGDAARQQLGGRPMLPTSAMPG
jgi:hypothetical protein